MKRRRTFLECFCEAIIEVVTSPLKELRDIARKPAGYLKLAQSIIIIFALGSFLILMAYTMIFDKSFIDPDIFITVIVGLIGTIVGMFFSESAMRQIEQEKKELELDIKDKKYDLKYVAKALDKSLRDYQKIESKLNEELSKKKK